MLSAVSFLVAKVYSKLKGKENSNAYISEKLHIHIKSDIVCSQTLEYKHNLYLKINHGFVPDEDKQNRA